jgi:glucokinase
VGLVDRAGNLTDVAHATTPRTADPEIIWAVLADLVADVCPRGEPIVCGVGCGGPMVPRGEQVSPLNIPAWRGFPLRARLAALTALPTFVDNDAKALALGEGWRGAAAGSRDYMAMVVSTGVGGGIVSSGRLLDGRSGNAGHVGHVVVVPGGRRCRCGGQGCLEAEASGTAIEAITGRPAAQAGPDVVTRTGMLVGRAVASVVNLLDLPLVVVAGSVALGFGEPFFDAAQAELDLLARLDFSEGSRIVRAGLGPSGPLIGAGAVGWQSLASPMGAGTAGAPGTAGDQVQTDQVRTDQVRPNRVQTDQVQPDRARERPG